MEALAIREKRMERTEDLTRISFRRLFEIAADETHTLHDKAIHAFVDRVIDAEIETRLVLVHENTGYSPISSTALAGQQVGGGQKVESLAILYDRGVRFPSKFHRWAHGELSRLPDRQYVAILIQGIKKDSRKVADDWATDYSRIVANMPDYLQKLGFPRGSARQVNFSNENVLKSAAKRGRVSLLMSMQYMLRKIDYSDISG